MNKKIVVDDTEPVATPAPLPDDVPVQGSCPATARKGRQGRDELVLHVAAAVPINRAPNSILDI